MKWLIWREFRLNQLIVLVAAILLVAPYVVSLIGLLVAWWWGALPSRVLRAANELTVLQVISAAIGGSAVFSVVLNQLTMGLLGGNAFAGERADRSAEFMAYLPVSRGRRLTSKLLLAALLVLVVWGVNSLVLLTVQIDSRHNDLPGIWGFAAITGLTFYCVGWLVSSLQPVPTFAVAAGLATPLLVMLACQLTVLTINPTRNPAFYIGVAYAAICLAISLVSFPLGTWFYLRRVEP